MFYKGKHDKKTLAKGEAKSGRVFRTVGYALAGTALLSFSTVQSGLVNPQAIAETSASSDQSTTQDASVTSTLAYSSASNAEEKNETAYVFSKADGSVKNTKVSVELKNPDKAKTLRDQTDLMNLENTENDGEHATTSEGTVWESKGGNVYYMGDTDKEAPVKMKVSYKLDGEEISPDDLVGKSGKVTIRFDFANNSYEWKTINGEKTKIYTPFMALTGLLLDNDQFSNVKAKNAKVLDDGDRTIVAGYALPGLQKSLDVDEDDYKVPDYIQITADTSDFELNQTLTMVTNDLFNDIDTDELDTDKLDDAIDQLQDGMDQLIDGSSDLVTGLDNLAGGAHTLSNGAGTLANGTTTLASGTGTLKSSTKTLPSSVKQLNRGMQSLNKGLGTASSGSKTLASGTGTLHDSLDLFKNGDSKQTGLSDALDGIGEDDDTGSSTLIGGVNTMKSGVDSMLPTLTEAQSVAGGVLTNNKKNIAVLLKTLQSSQGTIDALNKKIDAMPDDASVTVAGLQSELTTLKSKIASAKSQVTSAKNLQSSLASALSTSSEEESAISGEIESEVASKLKSDEFQQELSGKVDSAAKTAVQSATAGSASSMQTAMTQAQLTEQQQAAVQQIVEQAATQAATAAAKAGATVGATEGASAGAQIGASVTKSAVQQKAGKLASSSELKELSATLDEIDGYLSTENLAKASASIDSVNTLLSSLDSTELSYDTALLKRYYTTIESYLSKLDPDTAASTLQARIDTTVSSVAALSDGLAAEKQGLVSLRDGGTTADGRTSAGISGAVKALGDDGTNGTLINGAKQLSNGAGSLSTGLSSAAGGSKKLASGTKQLNAAAPKLYNGIVSLDNGAKKLDAGAQTLYKGSKTLAQGADTAADGSKTLADGLKTYNRKGIQKIVDAYNDNLKGLSDRVAAVHDVGKAYTNFSGIAKGTKGKVKFIFETDAIEHDDDE